MEYECPEAAQIALDQMNGVMLGGRNIKVCPLPGFLMSFLYCPLCIGASGPIYLYLCFASKWAVSWLLEVALFCRRFLAWYSFPLMVAGLQSPPLIG